MPLSLTPRGVYYPDTMSPAARKAVQAARDWRFWRDRVELDDSETNLDLEELAGEVARWRALEVIAPGVPEPDAAWPKVREQMLEGDALLCEDRG